jgi:aminoglycoside adenylyltransferase-like protein
VSFSREAQRALDPSNHPEINSVLQELLSGAREILGDHFVGMYLDGSLAIGDFEPDKSDLDFVVVTGSEISSDTFAALKAMHDRLAIGPSKWARELEGSYISQRALRHDRRPAAHPYIDRGSALAMVHPESGYWPIHRHMLREHGVVLAGPPPQTLIDPVQPEELREAVRGILREWWMPMLVDAPLLQNGFYRSYAVLTMSRMLYTIRHGVIVTKPIAARWAQQALDKRWTPLIQQALAWSREAPPDLEETLVYIRHTCESVERIGPDVEHG